MSIKCVFTPRCSRESLISPNNGAHLCGFRHKQRCCVLKLSVQFYLGKTCYPFVISDNWPTLIIKFYSNLKLLWSEDDDVMGSVCTTELTAALFISAAGKDQRRTFEAFCGDRFWFGQMVCPNFMQVRVAATSRLLGLAATEISGTEMSQ